MSLICVFGYAVYLVPYEFVFWQCDAVLGTADNGDKLIDITYNACMSAYLAIFVLYCLQRAQLESDRLAAQQL